MRRAAETCADHLQESLGSRSVQFELNGQHREEQDLDRCTGGIPERSADAVLRAAHSNSIGTFRNIMCGI